MVGVWGCSEGIFDSSITHAEGLVFHGRAVNILIACAKALFNETVIKIPNPPGESGSSICEK